MHRCFRFSVEFNLPHTLSLELINQWVYESGFKWGRDSYAFERLDPRLAAYLSYWLDIYKGVLLESGVPMFQAPMIRKLEARGLERYCMTIEIRELDGFEPALRYALPLCGELLITLNQTNFSLENFVKVGEWVHEKLYGPLKKASFSGVSTIPILRYAYQHSIPFKHLGKGIYRLGYGHLAQTLSKSATQADSFLGGSISESKQLSAQLFRALGFPAAQHQVISTVDEAKQAAKDLGFPVVVKPENSNRSEGVSIDIDSELSLETAYTLAKKFSDKILVEKQCAGITYRFFVFQDEVLYVNANKPRVVVADGQSSIEKLLEQDALAQKLTVPWKRKPAIPKDSETQVCLQEQGLSLESVPELGSLIQVRKVASTQWGSHNSHNVELCSIHPENLKLAVRAAQSVHLTTAGVDIICEDLTQPWFEQECLIPEVNFSPMLGVSPASILALPRYFAKLFPNGARISIEVFIGQSQAWEMAQQRQLEKLQQGESCYLTSHNKTLNSQQQNEYLPFETLHQRAQALLSWQQVTALILVIQNDEMLREGKPVDQVSRLSITDEWIECAQPYAVASSKDEHKSHTHTKIVELYKQLVENAVTQA